MATTSLGRLTLDLAVKLSEFTDGMSRAERETQQRTRNMERSVNNFKGSLLDAIGGTEIGDAIEGLNSKFESISGSASMAAAGLGGMAIGGAVAAATSLTKLAIETANADAEMAKLAQTAGTGLKSFQTLAYAAKEYNITQEQLSSLLADTQEKLGEFTASGTGGAVDFFDQLKARTQQSDEAMQAFAQTLQGKDGIEAIRMIKNQMDEWGLTTQEQRFILESLGSDLGNLQPVLSMTASEWDAYGRSLEEAGIVKSQDAINKSIELEQQTRALTDTYDGIRNKFAGAVIPVLADLLTDLTGVKDETDNLNNSLTSVDPVVDSVRKAFIGASAEVRLWALDLKALNFQLNNTWGFLNDITNAGSIGDVINSYKTRNEASINDWQTYLSNRRRVVNGEDLAKQGIGGFNTGSGAVGGIKFSLGEVMGNQQVLKPITNIAQNTATSAKTGKQLLDEQKAREKAQAASNKTKSRSAKELGSNYVSNTELKGLKLKSNEAIGGGKARGYTAEMAYITQNLLGNDLKYFSAINDRYHKGKNSRHNSGQAFDVVLNDARKAKEAVALIKQAAKEYGYQVKILDEYSNPSKHATGGHLHVSVYGQKDVEGGGADINWIKQQSAERLREQERTAQEEARKLEQKLQLQNSIAYRYASEREKAEIDHQKRLQEIDKAYGDTPEAAKYKAEEEARYENEKHARALSIMQKYQSEEEKLTRQHEQALQEIRNTIAKDSPQYQLALDAQEAFFKEEMRRIRYQDGEKFRQVQRYIGGIRASIEQGNYGAGQSITDTIARQTMSESGYAMFSLGNQEDMARAGVNQEYSERQESINARDSNGDFVIQNTLERNKLLEEAKAEHEAKMYAIDLDFANKRKELEKEVTDKKIALYQSATGSILGVMQGFFGESKTLQRLAWASDKGMTLARILLKEKEALMNAWGSAPFPYNLGAVATTAVETGALAAAASAITPKGFQAGGYTGNMGVDQAAGIVHGQEFVFDAMSTKTIGVDNLERIRQGKGLGGDINIYNYAPGVDATATRREDGTVDVKIEQSIKQSWANLQNPNSFESNMINSGYQVQRRRR